jgi:squalene monooxygenase
LGLGECLEGIDAIDCLGYSVFFQGQPADIPYTINPDTKESYRGKSFHHGRFVQKLREFALKQPQVTKLEATVTKLVTDPENSNRVVGVQFKTNDNRETQLALADLTVVSDGCFSKFRKVTHLEQSKALSTFCGYVLKDCKLPYQNKGHVVLTRSGPVLLYQIGNRETRVLVDVLGELPSNSNGDLTKFMLNEVAVDLPETIRPSFIEACNTQRVRTMPNSYLPPSNNQREGVLVLGDALNMRHPLTGGGMTVAFMDVEILQNLFDPSIVESFEDFSLIKSQLEKFYWLRKSGSTNINVLACALHALFQSKGNLDLHMLMLLHSLIFFI